MYSIDLVGRGQIDLLDTVIKRQAKSIGPAVKLGIQGILNHNNIWITELYTENVGTGGVMTEQNSWVVGQSVQLVQEAPRGLMVTLFPFMCLAFPTSCLKQP